MPLSREKEDQTQDRVRVSGTNRSRGELTVSGLTGDQMEIFEGAMHGMWWAIVIDGKLVERPYYLPLPDPIRDEEMYPFWRKPVPGEVSMSLFDLEAMNEHSSPSISIQHLCGYAYTPENYKLEAEKLESWGFLCLRSRRSESGRFWEIWFLSSFWSAQGQLKDEINKVKGHNQRLKLQAALEFLRHNVLFGSLDVSVQRLAMGPPD